MNAILPLFPLQVVLLPATPQLLHIFEPRYRRLLADCQQGDQRFGLSRLRAEEHAPHPGDVGCRAVIRSAQTLPDGRSNILAVGERRFVIEEIVDTDRPYYEGRVRYFDDVDADDPAVVQLADQVWQALRRLRDAQAQGAPAEADRPDHPTDLSFLVTAALDLSLDERETLLRLTSARERLNRLAVLVEGATEAARAELAMADRARRNGRGDHPPDLTGS